MKRTIEVKRDGAVYYRGYYEACLLNTVRKQFKMWRLGRYKITITKGTKYRLDHSVHIWDAGKIVGYVCHRRFISLFFEPDGRKRYDITVKRVK